MLDGLSAGWPPDAPGPGAADRWATSFATPRGLTGVAVLTVGREFASSTVSASPSPRTPSSGQPAGGQAQFQPRCEAGGFALSLLAGDEERQHFPHGVAVPPSTRGERLGLTVSALARSRSSRRCRRSISRQAAMHECCAAGGRSQPAGRRSGGGRPAFARGFHRSRTGTASPRGRAPRGAADRRRARLARVPPARRRGRGDHALRRRGARVEAGGPRPARSTSASATRWTADGGGGLRPGRGPHRLRARLGRGPASSWRGARRPLERGRVPGHDGHELHRVVAVHARRRRAGRKSPRRSRRRSSAGSRIATAGAAAHRRRQQAVERLAERGRSRSPPRPTGESSTSSSKVRASAAASSATVSSEEGRARGKPAQTSSWRPLRRLGVATGPVRGGRGLDDP